MYDEKEKHENNDADFNSIQIEIYVHITFEDAKLVFGKNFTLYWPKFLIYVILKCH